MADIKLRPATPIDTPMLAHLWVNAFPDFLTPILGEKAELIIYDWLSLSQRYVQTSTVAEIEGQVTGFIMLAIPTTYHNNEMQCLWYALRQYDGFFRATWKLWLMKLVDSDYQATRNELYIEMLGVDPNWRGQGVAQRLMAYAKAIAQSSQADWLTLSVVSDNESAISLYKKIGFEPMTTHPNRVLKWLTGQPGYNHMAKRVATQP